MRRSLKRLLLGLVAAPVALYLLLALVFWVWGTVRLHFEVKRWEALGVPTRLSDWRPKDVPPETNAAPLYESLRGRLQLTEADAAALDDPWSIENPAEFIKPYEEVLEQYMEISKRTSLVWGDQHFRLDCPNICHKCSGIFNVWDGIRQTDLSRLMLIKAHARHKEGDDISEIVSAAWKISSLVASTGYCVDTLVGLRTEMLFLDALPHFNSSDPNFFATYLAELPETDPSLFMRRVAAYETVLHLQFYENHVADGSCS